MGLFSKNKTHQEDTPVLHQCWGLRLDTDLVGQLDRFSKIFEVFNEKVYTREEIDKMTDAFKQQEDAFDFWEVFVWIDSSIELEFKTILQTVFITEIDFEGVKKFNVMNDVTEENLQRAFEYVKQIGFIYGASFGSIPEVKLYGNVYDYLIKNYKILLSRHFKRIDFSTVIMEKKHYDEYVSFINLK